MKELSTATRVALILSLLSVPAAALQWTAYEGVARGFPVLRDASGKKIADGDFVQWVEKDRLHVRIVYSGASRRIEERAVFRRRPELLQQQWSLRESKDGALVREYSVDFARRTATAKKAEKGEMKEWTEDLDVDPGRAFAGFGFTLAVKALRRRLIRGEHVELQAVGFTPKPKVVAVDVSYGGIDRIRMSDRVLRGERYIVHAKLPWFADLFVDVPDEHIWLTSPPPAMFLRWEGPMAEPSDPPTRVDLLPGGASGAAIPVGTSGR